MKREYKISNRAEEMARYLCWSGGSFIFLRDKSEEIERQLTTVSEGRIRSLGDVLRCMRDYERLPRIEPYLSRQEIEVVRCMACGKTVSNHLEQT
jgi:DNA-binding NarL/FixJ family response regulator